MRGRSGNPLSHALTFNPYRHESGTFAGRSCHARGGALDRSPALSETADLMKRY
jgi:hypothetical protein